MNCVENGEDREGPIREFSRPIDGYSSPATDVVLESVFLYSCPSLVVPFFEELISRPFLDENRFRLVSQDRMSAQNGIGYLFFSPPTTFVLPHVINKQIISEFSSDC